MTELSQSPKCPSFTTHQTAT